MISGKLPLGLGLVGLQAEHLQIRLGAIAFAEEDKPQPCSMNFMSQGNISPYGSFDAVLEGVPAGSNVTFCGSLVVPSGIDAGQLVDSTEHEGLLTYANFQIRGIVPPAEELSASSVPFYLVDRGAWSIAHSSGASGNTVRVASSVVGLVSSPVNLCISAAVLACCVVLARAAGCAASPGAPAGLGAAEGLLEAEWDEERADKDISMDASHELNEGFVLKELESSAASITSARWDCSPVLKREGEGEGEGEEDLLGSPLFNPAALQRCPSAPIKEQAKRPLLPRAALLAVKRTIEFGGAAATEDPAESQSQLPAAGREGQIQEDAAQQPAAVHFAVSPLGQGDDDEDDDEDVQAGMGSSGEMTRGAAGRTHLASSLLVHGRAEADGEGDASPSQGTEGTVGQPRRETEVVTPASAPGSAFRLFREQDEVEEHQESGVDASQGTREEDEEEEVSGKGSGAAAGHAVAEGSAAGSTEVPAAHSSHEVPRPEPSAQLQTTATKAAGLLHVSSHLAGARSPPPKGFKGAHGKRARVLQQQAGVSASHLAAALWRVANERRQKQRQEEAKEEDKRGAHDPHADEHLEQFNVKSLESKAPAIGTKRPREEAGGAEEREQAQSNRSEGSKSSLRGFKGGRPAAQPALKRLRAAARRPKGETMPVAVGGPAVHMQVDDGIAAALQGAVYKKAGKVHGEGRELGPAGKGARRGAVRTTSEAGRLPAGFVAAGGIGTGRVHAGY